MDPDRAICSAKGCQADAVWDLQWNNPKIHTPERRKSGSPATSTGSRSRTSSVRAEVPRRTS